VSLFADPVADRLNNLFKVGAEGYVHGWRCERPPCGRGSWVSHPERGRGQITGSHDGHMVARFDDGSEAELGDQAKPEPAPHHSLFSRLVNPGGGIPERMPPNLRRPAQITVPRATPRDVVAGVAESLNPLSGARDTPYYRQTVDPGGTVAAHRVRSRAEALGQHAGFWNA
jgi:hypothetical protein